MRVRGLLALLFAGCFVGLLAVDAHAVATKAVKVTVPGGPRASVTIRATDGSAEKTEQADDQGVAYFWMDTDKTYDVQVVTANGTFFESRNQRLNGEVALDTKSMTQHGDPTMKSSSSLMSRANANRWFPASLLSKDSDLPTGPTLEVGVGVGTNWASLSNVSTRTSGGATELSDFKQAESIAGGLDATLWFLNGLGARIGYLHSQNNIKPGRIIEGGAASGFVDIPGTSVVHDILSLSAMYRCTCLIFRPYVGVGLDITRTSMTNGINNETEQAFGFNAQTGASYPIPGLKGARIGVDYYLHMFNVQNDHFNAGPGNTNIAINGTQMIHGANATLRYEFNAPRF